MPKVLLPTIDEDAEPPTAKRLDEEYEHMRRERSNVKRVISMPAYGSDNETSGKKKSKEAMSRGLVKKLVRKMNTEDPDLCELRSQRVEPDTSKAAK